MRIIGRILTIIAIVAMSVYGAATFAADKAPDRVDKVLNFLGEKGQQYINGLEELTKQYAPEVVDAALTIVQIKGLQEIIYGAFWLLLGAGIGGFWLLRKGFLEVRKPRADVDVFMPCFLVGGMLQVATCAGIILLFDIWNWVAVFEPKLYLAKQIFSAVLK